MPRFRQNVLAAAAVAAMASAASVASAQSITILVKDGDFFAGVGAVTLINNLSVNNNGDWIVEVDTDGPTTADAALIRNGVVYLQEDQMIAGVDPGNISSFDAVNLNNAGVYGGNVFFRNTGSTSTDSGVLQNTGLVMQEGTISTAPQFSPNTPYIGWFETRLNDVGQHLLVASVDDPAIATTVDRAVVIWNVSPTGQLLSELVLAKEGDVLPGHDQAAADFETGPHGSAFNNAGTAMFVVDGAGDTATDHAVYVGNTMIAREGSPSGIDGRDWSATGLGSVRLDINNSGGYIHTGTLAGDTASDLVIVRNGSKVIQEGDTLPAIGGVFTFTSFGTGAVQIDDGGNAYWYGDWNDPDLTRDTGIFMNDQLLVQEGVTMIEGSLLTSIVAGQDNFEVSDNGLFLIFEGQLEGGIDGAFMVAIPEPGSIALAGAAAGAMLLRRRRVA